jgi:hypothetical protein
MLPDSAGRIQLALGAFVRQAFWLFVSRTGSRFLGIFN